jgi:hypothetical protein
LVEGIERRLSASQQVKQANCHGGIVVSAKRCAVFDLLLLLLLLLAMMMMML